MVNCRNEFVAASKLGGIAAVAAFAVTFSAAGRVLADPARSPATGSPDDTRIVQRVVDFNRGEERAADAVRGKLASLSTWELAQRIRVDYAAFDRELSLASASEPTTGPADGGSRIALLPSALSDLDKTYVSGVVKAHEDMLAALDRELIPNAKDEQLQRRLLEERTEVAVHLASARAVQNAQTTIDLYDQEREDISKEVGQSGP
jgi:putative membrane protein